MNCTRREFTAAGAAALLPLAGHPLLEAAEEKKTPDSKRSATACIFVWLEGGPSTWDMWDLKQGRAAGPFRPIPTAGDVEICEHLPRVAKVMDRLSIVCTVSSKPSSHQTRYFMHTGFRPRPRIMHPSFGSVVSRELSPKRSDQRLPAFVSIDGPSVGPGVLGPKHAPFVVDSEAAWIQRHRPTKNVSARNEFLDQLNSQFNEGRLSNAPALRGEAQERIARLTNSKALKHFQADLDDPRRLELYGANKFGRALMLARRLIEADVSFVQVQFPLSWDIRDRFFETLRSKHLPMLDAGLSALVSDLVQRGLWERVVVVVSGDRGREPGSRSGRARAHSMECWSMVMGGGGLKGGIGVGETGPFGSPKSRPYLPNNIWATVATAMGIPLTTAYRASNGRSYRVAGGAMPINELLPRRS